MTFESSLTATSRIFTKKTTNIKNKTYRRFIVVRAKSRNFIKDATFFPGCVDVLRIREIYRPDISIIDDSVFHVDNCSLIKKNENFNN